MTISRRPLLVLLPLVFSLSGCIWHGEQPIPEPSSSRRLPNALRVTLTDQSVVLLEDAVVSGDSLVGYVGREQARTAVALADVQSVKDRYTNYVATVFVTTVTALAAMMTAVYGFGVGL
jgi:hypothetical protein